MGTTANMKPTQSVTPCLGVRNPEASEHADQYGISVAVTLLPGFGEGLDLLSPAYLNTVGGIVRQTEVPRGETNAGRVTDRVWVSTWVEHDESGKPVLSREWNCRTGALGRENIDRLQDEVERSERVTGLRVVLLVGNGNLGANPFFYAYVARRHPGEPRGVYSTPEFPPRPDQAYPALVCRDPDGAVTIERIRFQRTRPAIRSAGRGGEFFDSDGRILAENPEAVRWATSGIPIVEDGVPISMDRFIDLAAHGWFYDLNHVFALAWLKARSLATEPPDATVLTQVPYTAMLTADGNLDPDQITRALHGETITVRLDDRIVDAQCGYDDLNEFLDALKKGLFRRGYEENAAASGALGPGEFRIENGTLSIRFLPGAYPHSAVGVSQGGRVLLFQVTFPNGGRMIGNRSALTIPGTAEAVAEAGNRALAESGKNDTLKDALILDNGGDVRLWVRRADDGWDKWVAEEIPRDRLRSALIFTGAKTPPERLSWDALDLLRGATWKPCAGAHVLRR